MKKIKKVVCASGLTGWQCRLQDNYDNYLDFESYCNTYNLHITLGFDWPIHAWKANPIIQGSVNPSDFRIVEKPIKTIDKIITKVDSRFGAPMGRQNIDNCIRETHNGKVYSHTGHLFDCAVPMVDGGAYDKGGAYWGIGRQLRVQYNKQLTYVRFYRKGDNLDFPITIGNPIKL